MKKILKSKKDVYQPIRNEKGAIDESIWIIIIIFIVALLVGLVINVLPVIIAKSQLNHYANEIVRIAEISGEVGQDVDNEIEKLNKSIAEPDKIEWSTKYINGTNKVQLNEEIKVTVKKTMDLSFFDFASFPVPLVSNATGRSEAYWK